MSEPHPRGPEDRGHAGRGSRRRVRQRVRVRSRSPEPESRGPTRLQQVKSWGPKIGGALLLGACAFLVVLALIQLFGTDRLAAPPPPPSE